MPTGWWFCFHTAYPPVLESLRTTVVLCVLSTRHYLSFYVSEGNDFWAHRSSGVGRQPELASFKAKVTSCTKGSDEWGQVTCSDADLPESNVTCFRPPWANSLDSFAICALLNSLSFSVFICTRWYALQETAWNPNDSFRVLRLGLLAWRVPKGFIYFWWASMHLNFILKCEFESIDGKWGKYWWHTLGCCVLIVLTGHIIWYICACYSNLFQSV